MAKIKRDYEYAVVKDGQIVTYAVMSVPPELETGFDDHYIIFDDIPAYDKYNEKLVNDDVVIDEERKVVIFKYKVEPLTQEEKARLVNKFKDLFLTKLKEITNNFVNFKVNNIALVVTLNSGTEINLDFNREIYELLKVLVDTAVDSFDFRTSDNNLVTLNSQDISFLNNALLTLKPLLRQNKWDLESKVDTVVASDLQAMDHTPFDFVFNTYISNLNSLLASKNIPVEVKYASKPINKTVMNDLMER